MSYTPLNELPLGSVNHLPRCNYISIAFWNWACAAEFSLPVNCYKHLTMQHKNIPRIYFFCSLKIYLKRSYLSSILFLLFDVACNSPITIKTHPTIKNSTASLKSLFWVYEKYLIWALLRHFYICTAEMKTNSPKLYLATQPSLYNKLILNTIMEPFWKNKKCGHNLQ